MAAGGERLARRKTYPPGPDDAETITRVHHVVGSVDTYAIDANFMQVVG